MWADPKGEYAAVVAAAPVFELLGKQSITNPEMPALGQPRHEGHTGYHIRAGGHGLGDTDGNGDVDIIETYAEVDGAAVLARREEDKNSLQPEEEEPEKTAEFEDEVAESHGQRSQRDAGRKYAPSAVALQW